MLNFIGDVHGNWQYYNRIVKRLKGPSVQVGDFGVGFQNDAQINPQKLRANKHLFFRGNHDNPRLCQMMVNYLGDYGYIGNFFFMGGAYSIDWESRKPGKTWWPDEQLSEGALKNALDLYLVKRPRFVVTHDAPTSAANALLNYIQGNNLTAENARNYFSEKQHGIMYSRMSYWMEKMLMVHQPERWIFGHFHVRHSFQIPHCDTVFTALGELEVKEFEEITL